MCSAQGIRSLSDLARTAMQRLIEEPKDEIGDLREQMRALAQELERLSRVLASRGEL
jgi:HAMP domain-containing protein